MVNLLYKLRNCDCVHIMQHINNLISVAHLTTTLHINNLTRSSFDHDPDGIEDACRLSLKNLQLDYLDLYLVHHPCALRKGCTFANMTEEDKLGYDPERMAKIWKVCLELVGLRLLYICTCNS